jgi:hypothetical protein
LNRVRCVSAAAAPTDLPTWRVGGWAGAHVDGRARVGWLQDKAYPWSRLREQPAQILRTTLFTTWEDGTSHLSVLHAAHARPCSQLRFARGVITWRSARDARARACVRPHLRGRGVCAGTDWARRCHICAGTDRYDRWGLQTMIRTAVKKEQLSSLTEILKVAPTGPKVVGYAGVGGRGRGGLGGGGVMTAVVCADFHRDPRAWDFVVAFLPRLSTGPLLLLSQECPAAPRLGIDPHCCGTERTKCLAHFERHKSERNRIKIFTIQCANVVAAS